MSSPNRPQVNGEELYIVVNAGCREKDLDHIGKHLKAFQVRGASVYSTHFV
jgi:aminomethyltransferase